MIHTFGSIFLWYGISIFQVRCKNSNLCSQQGVKIILTGLNKTDEAGFVLSSKAFMGMARKGFDQEIKKHLVMDVEYKR